MDFTAMEHLARLSARCDAADTKIDALKGLHEAHALEIQRIPTIERNARRAQDIAEEARRDADSSRHYVEQVVNAMKVHMDTISSTLGAQGAAIVQQGSALEKSMHMLDEHTVELKGQTRSLRHLETSDEKRQVKEEITERYARDARVWVRWGVPIVVTMLLSLIGGTFWLAAHTVPDPVAHDTQQP